MISMTNVHIDMECMQAIFNVLKSSQLTQGLKVKEFEQAFAHYIGTKYAVAVSNDDR